MTIRTDTLLAWLAALALCSWWVFSQVSLRTDMSLFLPEGTAADQQILLNEINQGPANRLLLLAITQGDAASRAALSQQLTARLRSSPLLSRVENGAPGALQIDPLLFKYRYLISAGIDASAFSAERLNSALKQRLEELKAPFPSPFKDLLATDPVGSYQTMLRSWLAEKSIHREQGVWQSKQGEMALLLVQTLAGGLELDEQQAVLTYLQDEFDQLDQAAGHQLIISGPGVFGVQSRAVIHYETQTLSMVASALIALLLFSAYRFLPYLLFAALPLLSAMLVGAIVCQLAFGELHGITLAFGITLLGVTLDYPIHLFSHLRHSEPVNSTMLSIWRTLRLGVITTCIAYLVLLTTDFIGLRQLGLFTLTGLLTAALTSRLLLPRVFPEPFSPPQPRGMTLLSVMLQRKRWPSLVMLALAAISLTSLLLSSKPLWQDDISTFSPLPKALLEQDRQLRQHFSATDPSHLLLIQGEDPQQLLQRSEALRRHLQQDPAGASLLDIALPSDYLPSQQQQRATQASLPDRQQLSDNLQQAMQGLPFRQAAFEPFIAEIEQSRDLPPLSYAQAMSSELKTRLETMIREGESSWFALIPLQTVADPEQIERYVEENLTEVRYLNLKQQVSGLVGEFRQQTLERVALGAGLMSILLWIGLGSLKRTLTTLIPIGLAILTSVGVLHLIGETLNLFHMISLMLVLGIGLDYSLFFGRREQHQGDALLTLHALSVCALSTAGVFAILASSSIPVLHAIGLTVAIGVVMSYLATYALSRINS
ncbi:MAG: MMPL family transporter [Candidatus Thiodiazotropha taylori]